MKILITGGAGFIGSSLGLALNARGHSVRAMDNFSPQIHGEDPAASPLVRRLEGKVEVLRGDVRNRDDWLRALDGIDAIVHLAAETGTGQSMYEVEKYVDVNVRSTALMLDILVNGRHSVRKVVVASSRAIYGEGKYQCAEHGTVYPLSRREKDMSAGDFGVKCPVCGQDVECVPTDEGSAIHPTSIYGATKHDQERLVLMACESVGIPAVAFRYQNVYGPGQSLKNPYTGILSIFSTRLLNGNAIEVFEDGTESRDFVYIDDVIDATILGVENDSMAGRAFNVGSGERMSVVSVVELLRARLGLPDAPYVISGKYRLGDIRHNYADIGAAMAAGFKPKVDFAEGIGRFVDWVKTQVVEKDRYEESICEMREKGLYK